MTIEKGKPWGSPGSLPADGVVVRTDGELSAVLERRRVEGAPFPTAGLLGGDLCRTVGGPGVESRLTGPEAVAFPVDVAEVLVDGRLHLFVAHLVARTPTWSYAVAAMNAQWWGRWNLGPRAHPNDGVIDVYEARLPAGERWKVRQRLPLGAHLPHPGIRSQRTAAVQIELPRALPVHVDGRAVGKGRTLSIRVRPDALTVVV